MPKNEKELVKFYQPFLDRLKKIVRTNPGVDFWKAFLIWYIDAKYPEEIRRIIYTTNTIEAVHRQFRKLTKTKGSFPNQNSLLKLLYMGIRNASKKWTMPIQNWALTISQLAIFFEGRLDKELKI